MSLAKNPPPSKAVTLTKVDGGREQIEVLYSLLKERVFTISHSSIPSLKEHSKFVLHHPYRAWYIVFADKEPVGTLYLSADNGIGIFLKPGRLGLAAQLLKKIVRKHRPLPPIKSVRSKGFHVNVNPADAPLIAELKKLGMKHVQCTFSLAG